MVEWHMAWRALLACIKRFWSLDICISVAMCSASTRLNPDGESAAVSTGAASTVTTATTAGAGCAPNSAAASLLPPRRSWGDSMCPSLHRGGEWVDKNGRVRGLNEG